MTPEEYIQMRPIINVYGETEQEIKLRDELEDKINENNTDYRNLSRGIDNVADDLTSLEDDVEDCQDGLEGLQKDFDDKVEQLEDRIEFLEGQLKIVMKALEDRGINIECDSETTIKNPTD